MYLHQRQEAASAAVVVSEDDQKAESGTRVDEPWMVERRGDRIIWRLKAKDAAQGLSTMVLTAPILELFSDTGEIIVVKGDQGDLEPLSRNVHFKGHVDVTFQDWHLVSDDLRFDSRSDEVIVPHAFTATATNMLVKGRDMHVNRETQVIQINHDVRVEDSNPDHVGELP